MKKMQYLACVLMLTCSAPVMAQADKKPAEPHTISQVLNAQISNLENDFVPAAEAMPEDKYSFAPTSGKFKGVRTFAEQVKHVAAVNYVIGSAILGEKPPVDTGGEKGPESAKSKADIVKFLKDSFVYAHKAAGGINETNLVAGIKSPFGDGATTRLGMATAIAWHGFDHYGQMVEYLRMNGIIPPASRQ